MRLMKQLAIGALGISMIAGIAVADQLHLKDGTVIEGEIVREGDGYVYFKTTVGGIETVKFYTVDQFTKVERTTNTASADADENTGKADKDDSVASGDVPRIAVLNFGAPGAWQGEVGSTVGSIISAAVFRNAIPMLEKDGVTDVVVRINSGGGYLLEMEPFWRLFEDEYKPRFRTVAWVESAISCAAMSPWCIEEYYMMTHGNIGGCTGWSGQLVAMKGVGLEMVYAQMEEMSRDAGRDHRIMRSMQHLHPLSCDIDEETGKVTWYQDLTGDNIVNPAGRVLTFNAVDAVKYQFAQGIADTVDELARTMGYEEFEVGGLDAAKYIDESMKLAHESETRFNLTYAKYEDHIAFAAGTQDRKLRGGVVAKARKLLRELEKMTDVNPNFRLLRGMPPDWFDQQEQRLRDLMR